RVGGSTTGHPSWRTPPGPCAAFARNRRCAAPLHVAGRGSSALHIASASTCALKLARLFTRASPQPLVNRLSAPNNAHTPTATRCFIVSPQNPTAPVMASYRAASVPGDLVVFRAV